MSLGESKFCAQKKPNILQPSSPSSSENFLVNTLLGYHKALTPEDYIRHPSFDISPLSWNNLLDNLISKSTKQKIQDYLDLQPGNFVSTIFESRAKWPSLKEFSEYVRQSIICNTNLIINPQVKYFDDEEANEHFADNFALNAEKELVIFIVALDGSVMDYSGSPIASPTYQQIFISSEELGISGCSAKVNIIVGDHHHVNQSRSESPTTGQQAEKIEEILLKLGYNTDTSLSYHICDNDQDVLLSILRLTLFTGKQLIKHLQESGKLDRLEALASQSQILQAVQKLNTLIEDDAYIDIRAGYYDYRNVYPDYPKERLAFARGLYQDIRTFKFLKSKSPKDYVGSLHKNISRVMKYLMSPEQDIEKVLALPANARPKWYTDLVGAENYNPKIQVLDFCVSSTGFAFFIVDEGTPANRLQIPPTIDTINRALNMLGCVLPENIASVSAIAIHSEDPHTQNWTICGDPLIVSKMRIFINVAEEFYRNFKDGNYSKILTQLNVLSTQTNSDTSDALSKEIYTKLTTILRAHWKPDFRQNFDSKPSLRDVTGFIANHRRGSYLFDISIMSNFVRWFLDHHELVSRSIIELEPNQGIEYQSNWLQLTNISHATGMLNLVLQSFSKWISQILLNQLQNHYDHNNTLSPIFSSSFQKVESTNRQTSNQKLSNFLSYQGIELAAGIQPTEIVNHYFHPKHQIQGDVFPHRQTPTTNKQRIS